MSKSASNTPATEAFVWRVTNDLRNELNDNFEKLEKKMDKRFSTVIEHLTDIASKFQKFDEEHTILSHRASENSDRIKKLEEAVFKS